MNCNETQDLLSAFYDDELSVDVRLLLRNICRAVSHARGL